MSATDRPALSRGPPKHNLPAQLTSFVGRTEAVREGMRLLAGGRLLTLTGAGGVGKTRLALEVASGLLADYHDGVWFIDLAPLTDGDLVPRTVAAALAIKEEPTRSAADAVMDAVGCQRVLLVLDNCEHLVQACAALVDRLLRACPELRILATSREALRTPGETAWRVPSLSVPEPHVSAVDQLRHVEAAQLFADRARARQPEFEITQANAAPVGSICRQLDGIPLALELAAARVGILSPEQIADRLRYRFELLATGSRTAPPRQQTLLATLQWSYDLLAEEEQRVFAGLSVFVGGWTLEAAEAVCAGNGFDHAQVLELLSRLVDKSLVLAEPVPDGRMRYRMLESLRHYGRMQLRALAEFESVRRAHAQHFLQLAEGAQPQPLGREQVAWLDGLEQEHDNLRTALQWAVEAQQAEAGLRLASALAQFWTARGHLTEGRRWLEELLRLSDVRNVPTFVRARALAELGGLRRAQGDLDLARGALEESLALYEDIQDTHGKAHVLGVLGLAASQRGELTQAARLLEQSLALRQQVSDRVGQAVAFTNLGQVVLHQADLPRARALFERSIELRRELDDWHGMGQSLIALASIERQTGELGRARQLLEQSVGLFREARDTRGTAWALGELATVVRQQGEADPAAGLQQESLRLNRAVGDRRGIAACLNGFAALALARGRPEQATRLLGAAARLAEAGAFVAPDDDLRQRTLAAVRARLGDTRFGEAWSAGCSLSLEQAIGEALAMDTLSAEAVADPAQGAAHALTAREQQVLRLVAAGQSNREIAGELVLSVRTVERHVTNIYAKIGARGKADATAYAFRQGLI